MAELVGGAMLGAAIGELLREVIKIAQRARKCKKNCTILLTTLEIVSPALDRVIAKSANNSNLPCQAWLESMKVLMTDAKIVIEKCSQKKTWIDRVYLKSSKLSTHIVELDDQINKRLVQASVFIYDIVQDIHSDVLVKTSINVDVGNSGIATLQETPSKIVAFVANMFETLKSAIMDDVGQMDVPMTIGLKGRGGAGKTLLAKMVNNDEGIQRKFAANSILWITVGRDATLSSIYLTMAKLIEDEGVYERDFKHRNLEDQRGYMLTAFKARKVLLILDDVWDCYPANGRAMMEWLDVAKGIGSITLITTREAVVLKCGKAKTILEVKSLSKEDSWELFCIHAFGNLEPASLVIKGIAKEVCKECDGLPLAIEVIGSAMFEKDDEEEWLKTLKYLKGLSSMSYSKSMENRLEQKLYNQLKYSYDELDDVSKKCFLYLAAFPEDYEIVTKQLYCIWHVERFFGFLNEEESKSMGQSVLIDLAERSLVDFAKYGKVVKIHDVLRDLAIHILRHANMLEWHMNVFLDQGELWTHFWLLKRQ